MDIQVHVRLQSFGAASFTHPLGTSHEVGVTAQLKLVVGRTVVHARGCGAGLGIIATQVFSGSVAWKRVSQMRRPRWYSRPLLMLVIQVYSSLLLALMR